MVSADYRVDYRCSNGNIHVDVSGEFNRNTAGAVLEILQTAYTGSGRIFIDTAQIQNVVECGAEYFKTAFAAIDVPTACLFFKGKKGERIGPDGSRLLLMKEREKKCCGNCKNCSCKNHKSYQGE
ncbi:hypothetical protein JBF11_08905 [Taurinivorans muris]|uniref:Uncharacterized protein n=1 Tax=Taurinivorans muris TaxID=2787751 RepID=A0ABY5Y172_9BACT|nr:hypothetical protein JBF11_08905 [Desulfovibrionaceae bacterium LT0009]HBV42226.1 hypothetical protein [Desulfovibrio sp.]